MGQPISNLPLGSLIDIYENGVVQLYEVAGFNVHGANTATLVRKRVVSGYQVFDADSSLYNGSDLDIALQAFENNYTTPHRNAILSTSITYATGSGTSETIPRKVFALSYTELFGETNYGISENSHLPLYSNNASRIKTDGTYARQWYTRSRWSAGPLYVVAVGVGGAQAYIEATALNYKVPAFVISSNTLVSDSVTAEGGYFPLFDTSIPLAVSNMFPAGGFVHAGAEKQFSWATAPQDSHYDSLIVQASAKLRYRKVGAGSYTEINISGETNTYTIPAGTFDGNSDYEWQIAVTSNGGITTTSAWVQFTTKEALPQKPKLISPINTYVEIDSDIVFNWQHVIDTGSAQTRADLQYSRDGGEWTDLATIIGSNMTYTLPANTFIAGNYRWRARTYNTDNIPGEWSDSGSFVGVGAPPVPYISEITAASRPTISWQSVGQTGYQLQVMQGGAVIYDTGETAGTDKSLTLPFYLANGAYTVRIRVINTSLMWSAWAEMPFILSMTLPSAPSVEASAILNGAHIEISDIDENAVHVYLLRDGVPIADITGLNAYDDYSALGTVEYVVRVVDENENCADSAPATVTVTVESAVLAAVDDLTNIVKMSQKPEGQPAVSRRKQLIGTSHRYAGREHPVHVFSEFSDEYYSPTYYYTTLSEWAKLDALINRRQTVLYRDVFGNKYYGSITSVNHTQDNYMIVFTMSIERVDYVEQIPYAEAGA